MGATSDGWERERERERDDKTWWCLGYCKQIWGYCTRLQPNQVKINLSLCDYQKKKKNCVGYHGIRNLCWNSTCTKLSKAISLKWKVEVL